MIPFRGWGAPLMCATKLSKKKDMGLGHSEISFTVNKFEFQILVNLRRRNMTLSNESRSASHRSDSSTAEEILSLGAPEFS
jgi:hypothetical protein